MYLLHKKVAYVREYNRVIRSTSCLVIGLGFQGQGAADRIRCIFQFDRTHGGGNDMT